MYNKTKIDTILKNTEYDDTFTLSVSRNGTPVLKAFFDNCSFYINSRYNSEKEADNFAKEYYEPNKNILLYGIGMGFHIKSLVKLLKENQHIYIIEFNKQLVKFAFDNTDIGEILQQENITFDIAEDYTDAVSQIKKYGKEKNTLFICHEPSLRVMPKEYYEIKDVIESILISRRSYHKEETLLSENQKANLKKNYENGGKKFRCAYKGKTAIIVSAGPSLEINGKELKEVKGKAHIISVGRALKYLKEIGIKPDFAIITDPKKEVIGQLNLEETEIPLFFLSTIYPTVEKYKGEKFILFDSENDVVPKEEKQYTVETGGSVATTALSLAYLMGFSKIILIGQDLCYHSEKTHSGEKDTFINLKTNKVVKGIDGNEYISPLNLYEYYKWFKKFAKNHTDVELINCTAKGAFIEGFVHKKLSEVFE